MAVGSSAAGTGQISTITGGKLRGGTLDALLSTTYCRNQMYLSRQLAQLHPELTMPMFSGKFKFEKEIFSHPNIQLNAIYSFLCQIKFFLP